MGLFHRNTSTSDDDYEANHTAWRKARKDLNAARAKERHSTNPDVNAARAVGQQAVREEIRQAEQAEQAARKALRFPWER